MSEHGSQGTAQPRPPLAKAEVRGVWQGQGQGKLGLARAVTEHRIRCHCSNRACGSACSLPSTKKPVLEEKLSLGKACQKVVTHNEAINGVITR